MSILDRRKFIVDSVQAVGAVVAAVVLGDAMLLPEAEAKDIQFSELTCGNNNVKGKKILITYASEYGSTAKIAETMAETLCQRGKIVDVKPIGHVKDVSQYDAVIVGSAIHYDTWMSEAKTFVKQHQKELSKVPVFYFFTCLALSVHTEKSKQEAAGYFEKIPAVVPGIIPVSVGGFAGVLDYSKMSFFVRIAARGILAIKGAKEGDFRDWDAIKKWTLDADSTIS